jgi:hypothetical protein
MKLEIINNLTKQKLSFSVRDYYTSNIFFHFELRLQDNLEKIRIEDIVDGEYLYVLYDGVCEVANGLCQIGDYKAEVKEYKENKNKEKTYKVYGK